MFIQLKHEFSVLIKRNQYIKFLCLALFISLCLVIKDYSDLKSIEFTGKAVYNFFFLNSDYANMKMTLGLIMPLLCALPYADSFLKERGFLSSILLRTTKRKYYLTKLIVSFLLGFFLIFVFLMSYYIFISIILNHPENTFSYVNLGINANDSLYMDEMFLLSDALLNNPNLFTILSILLVSFYGGLLSMSTFTLSLFVRNKTIIYIGVFAFTLMLIPFLFFVLNPFSTWVPVQVFMAGGGNVVMREVAVLFWTFVPLLTCIALNFYKQREEVYS